MSFKSVLSSLFTFKPDENINKHNFNLIEDYNIKAYPDDDTAIKEPPKKIYPSLSINLEFMKTTVT